MTGAALTIEYQDGATFEVSVDAEFGTLAYDGEVGISFTPEGEIRVDTGDAFQSPDELAQFLENVAALVRFLGNEEDDDA